MVKAYISGKITGVADLNKPKFQQAEDALNEAMYIKNALSEENCEVIIVVNPHKLPTNHDKSWQSYMRVCISELASCTELHALDDWHESKGAVTEVLIAKLLNIPMFDFKTHTELNPPYRYLFAQLLKHL